MHASIHYRQPVAGFTCLIVLRVYISMESVVQPLLSICYATSRAFMYITFQHAVLPSLYNFFNAKKQKNSKQK